MWRRARLAATVVGAAAPLALACVGGPDVGAGLDVDGGPGSPDQGAPSGPSVTVRTSTPASSLGPSAPASATWAAYRREDGTWAPLAETQPGSATYAVPATTPRWAAAFACADDQSSLVVVREGAVGSTGSPDVELDRFCARALPDNVTLSGTISHLPQGTSWLDFGYPLESRGAVLPSAGNVASYEEVNLAAGVWDLAFGLRPSPGEAFSRVAIVRAETLAADATLDLDFGGPNVVAPGTGRISLDGFDPTHESIFAPVYFATSGAERGLDLGPQDIPLATPLVLAYATLPASFVLPGRDRYRAELSARANDDSAARGLIVEFGAPLDLQLTLPPPLPPPAVTLAATAPHPRVAARVSRRDDADDYVLDAVEQVSNRSSRAWRVRMTDPDPGADVALEMPDLSAVPGFDPTWSLPAGQGRVVTITVNGRPTTAAEPHHPWASSTLTMDP